MTTPCPTCPWRKSTRTGQIPGGGMDHARAARNMADDLTGKVMQCHRTADADPRACAGFMVRVGFDSVAVRLAAMLGYAHPRDFTDGGALLYRNMAEMLAAHPAPPRPPGLGGGKGRA